MRSQRKRSYILPVFLILLTGILLFKTVEANSPKETISYTVNKGDTLWDIAKAYKGRDPREVIYDIQELNTWTRTKQLNAGQTLELPQYDN